MDKCGLLNSKNDLFKEAFDEGFDLSDYYASCVFDVCENLNLNLHCQILEDAVNTASQSEIRIDLAKWRDVTNCRKFDFNCIILNFILLTFLSLISVNSDLYFWMAIKHLLSYLAKFIKKITSKKYFL